MKRRQGGNERKFFNPNSHKVQVVKPKRIDTPLSPTHSVPTRDEQWRYQRTLLSHNNLVRCWKASAKFVITSEKKLSWLQAQCKRKFFQRHRREVTDRTHDILQ